MPNEKLPEDLCCAPFPMRSPQVFATGGFVKELRIHGTENEALNSVAG